MMIKKNDENACDTFEQEGGGRWVILMTPLVVSC